MRTNRRSWSEAAARRHGCLTTRDGVRRASCTLAFRTPVDKSRNSIPSTGVLNLDAIEALIIRQLQTPESVKDMRCSAWRPRCYQRTRLSKSVKNMRCSALRRADLDEIFLHLSVKDMRCSALRLGMMLSLLSKMSDEDMRCSALRHDCRFDATHVCFDEGCGAAMRGKQKAPGHGADAAAANAAARRLL